jgi:acyl-CoA synthetase (AMP-forming)/AMP-acid ligase II
VSVENALYADQRVTEVAAVGVPHTRLGELVAAVVYAKPEYRDKVTEASLIATAGKRYALKL